MELITNLFWTFPSCFPGIFLLSFLDSQPLDFFAGGAGWDSFQPSSLLIEV